jgi:hypothetical protein
MIEELYILRKKNIKLLEELATLKLEKIQLANGYQEASATLCLELIEILDLLGEIPATDTSVIKQRLEKILHGQGVMRLSNPSLTVPGLCVTKDSVQLTAKHSIQKILKYGYMKNGEVFRPFLVEVA